MNQEGNSQEINQILMQFGPLHVNVEKREVGIVRREVEVHSHAKSDEYILLCHPAAILANNRMSSNNACSGVAYYFQY